MSRSAKLLVVCKNSKLKAAKEVIRLSNEFGEQPPAWAIDLCNVYAGSRTLEGDWLAIDASCIKGAVERLGNGNARVDLSTLGNVLGEFDDVLIEID